MTNAEARRRFAAATLAHLATADEHGRPHLVPMVFVLREETIYSAVDSKPKRTRALRRSAASATRVTIPASVRLATILVMVGGCTCSIDVGIVCGRESPF